MTHARSSRARSQWPIRFALSRLFGAAVFVALAAPPASAAEPMKALIIDGQNNHPTWPKTTVMMRSYLEQTGMFEVDIARTKFTWQGKNLLERYALPGVDTVNLRKPKADPDYAPDFAAYDVVLSNFGNSAAPWPEATKAAFEAYVSGGGGLIVVHAADNSFGDWPAFNEMIGVGGWGGRNVSAGPRVFFDEDGKLVRDTGRGPTGSHGPQHEFVVDIREPEHPITRGMPSAWLHAKDELYSSLRGPAQNMTVLASAYASPSMRGTGRHEPVMMVISHGKGRIFHSTLGHADYSMEGVGFIVSLQRGAEWAATGKVTQPIPDDFPTEAQATKRGFDN